MIILVVVLISFILIGFSIYFFNYKNNEKPKVGIKRNKLLEYLKDYSALKLYWGSIFLIVFGVVCLIAIGILELVFA